jgi:hypothetical protein
MPAQTHVAWALQSGALGMSTWRFGKRKWSRLVVACVALGVGGLGCGSDPEAAGGDARADDAPEICTGACLVGFHRIPGSCACTADHDAADVQMPASPLDAGIDVDVADAQADGALDADAADPCHCAPPPPSDPSVHLPLSCGCTDGLCARSRAATEQEMCADLEQHAAVLRATGCGKIAVAPDYGLAGGRAVFDAASGKLIGFSQFSDVPFGSCQAYVYAYGDPGPTKASCPAVTICLLCEKAPGPSTGKYPPCQ